MWLFLIRTFFMQRFVFYGSFDIKIDLKKNFAKSIIKFCHLIIIFEYKKKRLLYTWFDRFFLIHRSNSISFHCSHYMEAKSKDIFIIKVQVIKINPKIKTVYLNIYVLGLKGFSTFRSLKQMAMINARSKTIKNSWSLNFRFLRLHKLRCEPTFEFPKLIHRKSIIIENVIVKSMYWTIFSKKVTYFENKCVEGEAKKIKTKI